MTHDVWTVWNIMEKIIMIGRAYLLFCINFNSTFTYNSSYQDFWRQLKYFPSQKEHDFHNTEARRLYRAPVMSWRSQRCYHLFTLFYLRHELATFKYVRNFRNPDQQKPPAASSLWEPTQTWDRIAHRNLNDGSWRYYVSRDNVAVLPAVWS